MYRKLIQIRSAVLVYLTHKMALPLLKLIRRPEVFPYSLEQLEVFPEHSLGKDLQLFLNQKKLDLLPHYARHDIKHILLEYDTTDDGEVSLQCFMLGNGRISFPVLATVMYGMLTMPEHWKLFGKAYRRGRRATPIHRWAWFSILAHPTQELRQKINQKTEI